MVAVAAVTPTAIYTVPVSTAQSCGASFVKGAVDQRVGVLQRLVLFLTMRRPGTDEWCAAEARLPLVVARVRRSCEQPSGSRLMVGAGNFEIPTLPV